MASRAFKLESLDVYRKAINVCTRMYHHAGVDDERELPSKIRSLALEIVMNLASGLGFWDKMQKEHHFAAAKRAIMSVMPLIDMLWEGRSDDSVHQHIEEELQELGAMVNKLYIQAKKRRHEDGENG